jgi:hypothetical protein
MLITALPRKLLAIALCSGALLTAFPAEALHQVICYHGPNPWEDPLGPSPTLIARAQWDATDELVFDTHYMSTFATGPGCPNSTCSQTDSFFQPASAFIRFGTTTRYRYHVLYADAGYYWIFSNAQGFVRNPTTGQLIAGNELRSCQHYGYVARVVVGDFR